MRREQMKKWATPAFALVAIPFLAEAAPRIFRHVLPCVQSLSPVDGEMTVDYQNNTLWFQSGGTAHDLRGAVQHNPSLRFPDIEENAQQVIVKAAGPFQLSDGSLVSVSADQAFDVLQFEYGLGTIQQVNAGWSYLFAVPGSTAGTAAVINQTSSTPPTSLPSRYLGSVYFSWGPLCMPGAPPPPGGCALPSNTPQACLTYTDPSQCPTLNQRLIALPLYKRNNRYQYNLTVQLGTPPPPPPGSTTTTQAYPIINLSPFTTRVGFATPAGLQFVSGPVTLFGSATFWMPTTQASVSIVADSNNDQASVTIAGHEEDSSLYE